MAVVLIALMASGPAMAKKWNYSKEGVADDGGGTYDFRYDQKNFRYDDKSHWNAEEHIMWFKTQKKFDASKGNYYYEFELAGCFIEIAKYGKSEWTKTYIEGEVYVVTADGTEHRIGTWNKPKSNEKEVTYTSDENDYGSLYVSSMNTSNGHFNIRYLAGRAAVTEGVNKVCLRQRLTFKDSRVWDWWQYEKAIDLSAIDEDFPLPQLTADWGDDGKMHYTATDISVNDNMLKYGYWIRINFLENGIGRFGKLGDFKRGDESVTITEKPVNKENMEFSAWLKSKASDEIKDISYTTPVYVYYRANHLMNVTEANCGTTGWHYTQLNYYQPYLSLTVLPFTRPEKVNVTFDKWKKRNTVTWTKREKATLWDNSQRTQVECRTDGKWYVIRYDRNKTAKDYVLVGQPLRGDAETLQVEDTEIDYDKEYVYRVVFLPKVLEDKYEDDLVNLPGQKEKNSDTNLWNEAWTSTLMEVPVKLAQDRSDDSGIHLVWEYNVLTSGCEWRIDKHRMGQTTWTPVTTIPVDTKQSTASYLEEGGSVCDLFTYRIMTTINGKELFSDTLVCNLPAGAYISDVKVTTGSEEKFVKVKWKVARPGDDDIWFRVLRRPIGTDEWTMLNDEIHGHATEYEYKDENVMAGSYYEYSVEAYGAMCEGQLVQTDRRIAPGFSQARGTITGHISYGTGTAVAGVKVNLVKSSAGESTDQPQFLSRYIEGEGKGLQWTADSAKYANKLNGQQELTLQLWAKPSPDSEGEAAQSLLRLNGALELGIKTVNGTDYYLYATDFSVSGRDDRAPMEFPELTFDPYKFTHIAAVYGSGLWTFYVGTDTLHTATLSVESPDWNAVVAHASQRGSSSDDTIDDGDPTLGSVGYYPTLSIGGTLGDNPTLGSVGYYRGFVDDIRLWNRALSEKEIETNYTRILSGTENGLLLYWPLDEGINVRDYVFDVACQDGIYLLNHPEVGINATPSATVPEDLGLYGLTDMEGDYIIRGVPFQQGGTNYKLVPNLGVHEFSPNTRSMFVSPTSLTANNIDFEDVSSFPMSGHIYYAGTNVPAEGIRFYIDGELVTANGEVKTTDSDGYYEISVPIGEHYVEAKLDGHTMVSGGRFPTRGIYNFDRRTQYDFADSTLVNYVGRVTGGLRNDTLAVGFGLSNNNIGVATITLKLNNESFSFNCKDDHITDADAERSWMPAADAAGTAAATIRSHTRTGTGYDAKYIYIETDSLTGEFSALLPPLKYVTKSVRVNNNSDIEFTNLPEVDLTNVTQVLRDTLVQDTGSGTKVTSTYSYNTKTVHTYYANPRLEVTQKSVGSERNTPEGVFGLREIDDFVDDFGKTNITDIWTVEDDRVSYRFGYPLYRTGDKVKMTLYGYESYVNYDGDTPVTDNIPMDGQMIVIANEMSDEQMVVNRVTSEELELQPGDIYDLKTNELQLGSDGRNEFTWSVGFPNIVSPYTRQLSMSYERNGRTRVWEGFNAILLGTLNTGTNFVTLGPDIVTMVLRDAPGSNGKTSWTRGHSKTKLDFSSDAWYDDTKLATDFNSGVSVDVSTGLGVAVRSKKEIWFNKNGAVHLSGEIGNQTTRTWTTSVTETVATTGHNNYQMANVTNPSAKGDVFIGASMNLIIGDCRKVGLFRDGADAPFGVDLRDSKSIGDSIRTTFMYSAYELENVMIPKWKETRNAMFTFVGSEPEAKNYVNNTEKCVYVCWLPKDSLQADSVTAYRQVAPASIKEGDYYPDSVLWCNDQISTWKRQLAANEADKVMAMKKSQYFQRNISFDGLSDYSYTSKLDTTYQHKSYETHHVGGIVGWGTTTEMKTGALFKDSFSFSTENGWAHQESDTDYDDNTDDFAQFSYSMADGNAGTDFSVNIYSSPAGWSDIFSIVAGQSYNPWEGEAKTEYYQPGKHTLQNGTQRMEQPDIKISTDGNVGAKSATLTDVPSGQEGQFTIHLTNNSLVNMGFSFIYNVLVLEDQNNDGLSVFMDGFPANGRGVYVTQGETITKIIKVKQTDQSRLDYEGVKIRFVSQYQPAIIFDEVAFNVHFKPSSSPIDLVISEPVLNIETLVRNDSCVIMKLQNYDRQFKNLKSIGVQYRYEGDTQWNTIHTYVTNKADSLNRSFSLLPDRSDVTFRYNMMDDNMFPQGTYRFRAFTTTPYGENPNDAATVYSSEVTVVKDNQAPRQLTTPTPANGILRYGDDLSIEFNEDIVSGYVSDKNIIVTAKLNHQPVQHDVAKQLQPFGEEQRTVNPVFLNGDFSIDCWMLWRYPGTILRLGTGQLSLSINEEGHIVAGIASTEVVSKDVLPKNKWTYLVLSYKAADQTFTALAQYDTQTLPLFTNERVAEGVIPSVSHYDDNRLYLGRMDGAIHDLSLFNIYRDVNEAAATKYQAKDNYVYGLANYWPMNEGHGHVAADTRHTHDFEVNDSWMLENKNYALQFNDDQGAEADISRINTSAGDSYAIELWAHVTPNIGSNDEMTIFENTEDTEGAKQRNNRLGLYINVANDWILRYGQNEQVVVSHEDFPYIPSWAHVALNVVRGQAASFYYNGKRTAVIAERDVPPLEGARLTMGKGMGSYSEIDEVRIWHAALSESRLLSNMYNCIDTADVYSRGLVAYYPFEHTGTVDGVATKVPTLSSIAPAWKAGTTTIDLTPAGSFTMVQATPPLKNAAVETRLLAKPVASDRKVVISLVEGSGIKARDIEGTTLNITVDKIHDMHGNESLPIRWQAYVQQNTLKWTKDSVTVIKHYGDDYTFDVVIENLGGTTEYYTLYNMPQWLTLVTALDGSPVETTGDLAPLSQKTLRFAVSPLTPVGCYDITIGLQGNNAILEPLRIVLKVQGDQPAWTVDATAYENSMSIVGQVYLDGHLMENGESIVAAFIDDECRGIASPVKERGAAYVNLTVYGTSYAMVNNEQVAVDDGKPITFRIWDAYTGITYTDVKVTLPASETSESSETSVLFGTNKFYGDFSYPVILTKSDQVEQYLALHPNWNWISLGVEPKKKAPYSVFKGIKSWEALLKDYGTGISYSNGTSWSGPLTSVEPNTMYMLQLQRLDNSTDLPERLPIAGRQLTTEEAPVTIEPDWNWIAYTPMVTMAIDHALAGANPQEGDRIKSQMAFAIFGSNGVWEGELRALENGQGYMYYSTDKSKKTFTWPALSSISPARPALSSIVPAQKPLSSISPACEAGTTSSARGADTDPFTPVPPSTYPYNMTMVIQLITSTSPVPIDTCEVAAFVDGECRGATRTYEGLYYLLIAGEGSGMPLELRTCIDGQVVTIDNKLTFSTDANIGTPWKPYVIDLTDVQAIHDIHYSSNGGVETLYDLQGRKMDSQTLRQGVYIRNGKKLVIGDRTSINK